MRTPKNDALEAALAYAEKPPLSRFSETHPVQWNILNTAGDRKIESIPCIAARILAKAVRDLREQLAAVKRDRDYLADHWALKCNGLEKQLADLRDQLADIQKVSAERLEWHTESRRRAEKAEAALAEANAARESSLDAQKLQAALEQLRIERVEITQLRESERRLREALQFYADFGGTTEMEYDCGKRARTALAPEQPAAGKTGGQSNTEELNEEDVLIKAEAEKARACINSGIEKLMKLTGQNSYGIRSEVWNVLAAMWDRKQPTLSYEESSAPAKEMNNSS
jgi:hypothetical protein